MKTTKRVAVWIGTLMGAALACAPAFAADKPPETWDGLNKVKSKKVDLLYKKPEADFSGYARIMIDPVYVTFSKNFKPEQEIKYRVQPIDREKIKQTVADEFRKVFTEELQTKGGYNIVTEAAPDVLRVMPAIINLYINAPDTMEPGRSRSYTVSAGEMTLVAEFRDSETNDLLARAVDRRDAGDSSFMQWTTSVTNLAEARRIMGIWARALRDGLDAARGKNQ